MMVSKKSETPAWEPITDKNGNEPKPGDLIEIFRNVYEHWAVYVGDGFVVHLLGPDGSFSSSSSINIPIGRNNILRQMLVEVVSTDEWTINNIQDQERKPRPAEDIVRDANALVGRTRLYNVAKYNCEHFATELRYGNAESQQVEEAVTVGLSVTAVSVAVGVAFLAIFVWKTTSSSNN